MIEDTLLNTEAKRKSAIGAMTNLTNDEGWKLFVKILDANIEVLKDRIVKKPNDEKEAELDRLRDKVTVYEECKNTPNRLISALTPSDSSSEIEVDPFDTVESLERERSQKK